MFDRFTFSLRRFSSRLNYSLLTAYDLLALRYVVRSLPLRRVALVSFLGFSLGNNLGTLLAATPLRFRFYSRWGLSPSQIVVMMAILGLTFWSGLWFLGGTVLVCVPVELPEQVALPFGTRTLGAILLALAIGYLMVCCLWRKPWPIGKLHLRPPEPGLMAAQAGGCHCFLISATALYLVLPTAESVPFAMVLGAYLVGISVSLLTQVPGVWLDLILLTLLKGTVGDSVLASVLIFGLLYYILPLLVGMVVRALDLRWCRRSQTSEKSKVTFGSIPTWNPTRHSFVTVCNFGTGDDLKASMYPRA